MTPDYQHIDPCVLLDAAGHDVQVFLELSATFLDIAPSMFERLQLAIQTGNAAAITLESHSLKGTVALVGAEHLARTLAHIEALSRKTRLHEIPTLLPDLSISYAATEREVRASIMHFSGPTRSNEVIAGRPD